MRTRLKRLLFNKFAVFGIFLSGSGLMTYTLIGAHAQVPSPQKRVIITYKLNNQFDNPATAATAEADRVTALAQGLSTLSAKLQSMNVQVSETYDQLPVVAALADDAKIADLKSLPEVASVVESKEYKTSLFQSGQILNTQTAYTAGYDGTGEYVAILDTGFQENHAFLTGKIADEACYSGVGLVNPSQVVSNCPNNLASQTGAGAAHFCDLTIAGCEHGTHVAGIVGGISGTYNLPAPPLLSTAIGSKTFSGIAKGANIIAVNVFSKNVVGGSISAYEDDVLAGLNHVIALAGQAPYKGKIASVNMSLGGGNYADHATCDAADNGGAIGALPTGAEISAIATLRALGIATVIATGNSNQKNGVASPSCLTGAIAVGATDKNPGNTVACFSQSAAGMVSLLAPGMGNAGEVTCSGTNTPGIVNPSTALDYAIWSAKADATLTNTFADDMGTSMAAPHVAAAWAVLKQHSPSASVDSILAVLQNTGVNVTDAGNGVVNKRIDVGAAITAMNAPRTWTGGGTTNNWSDGGNWSLGMMPEANDTVTIDGTSSKPITIDVDVNVKSINVTGAYTGDITNSNKNITTTGNATFAGTGTLTLGTGTYTIGGNYDTSAQGTVTNGASLTISATGSVKPKTESYAAFTTSGTATATLMAGLKVTGNVTIGSGTTVVAGANTLTIGGNFTNSGTFTAGTSTVTFNGAAQTVSGATTFNILQKTNASSSLNFTSGQTFTVADIRLSGVSKNAKLTVHATTAASAATIQATGAKATTLSYLDLKDMTFAGYAASVNVNNSTDGGNNTGVTFVTAPGVTVTETGGSTAVVKSGATDTFTVELDKAPTADVNVAITSGAELTTNPTTLCFAAAATASCAMWNSPQTVTVTAVTPGVAGTHSVNITYAVTSTDGGYSGLAVAPTAVQISDAVVVAESTATSATISKPITLDVTGSGCNPTITNFTNVKESTFKENKSVDFPLGLNSFTIGTGTCTPGFTATVKVVLDKVYSDAAKFYKFSGSNTAESSVTDITSSVTFATETIGGKQVTTVSYQIVDGGPLDQDGAANGTIVDPAGVGVAQGATLSGLANTGSPIMLNIVIGATIIAIGIYVSTRTHIEQFNAKEGTVSRFVPAAAGGAPMPQQTFKREPAQAYTHPQVRPVAQQPVKPVQSVDFNQSRQDMLASRIRLSQSDAKPTRLIDNVR
jgi:hypothetical protein